MSEEPQIAVSGVGESALDVPSQAAQVQAQAEQFNSAEAIATLVIALRNMRARFNDPNALEWIAAGQAIEAAGYEP